MHNSPFIATHLRLSSSFIKGFHCLLLHNQAEKVPTADVLSTSFCIPLLRFVNKAMVQVGKAEEHKHDWV